MWAVERRFFEHTPRVDRPPPTLCSRLHGGLFAVIIDREKGLRTRIQKPKVVTEPLD
jgi:hypothetical protein